MTVVVKAVPRTKRTHAVGVLDGHLRVHIAAPPHDGQSNAALCAYLADAAGIRPRAARVRRGSSGARKLIELDGEPNSLIARLTTAFAGIDGEAP